MCAVIQSGMTRWADKEWEKSRKKAGDLGTQTERHAAQVKAEKDRVCYTEVASIDQFVMS